MFKLSQKSNYGHTWQTTGVEDHNKTFFNINKYLHCVYRAVINFHKGKCCGIKLMLPFN